MKGMDIFCASQAATAICLSMDQESSSSSPSSSSILLGSSSPAIDRYNPIITGSRRLGKPLPPSQPHLTPKPHKKKNKKVPYKENSNQGEKDDGKNLDEDTEKIKVSISRTSVSKTTGRKSWSCTRPGDFLSPPGSTRYLLGDKVVLNGLSDFDPSLKLFPAETSSLAATAKESKSCEAKRASPSPDQVVVLRVSLHCKGCERKMRKHISRMEGVTSFNIDFAAKKVTVSGKITPLEVLSSISKVKNAQLWSPTMATSTNQSFSGFKTGYKGNINVA